MPKLLNIDSLVRKWLKAGRPSEPGKGWPPEPREWSNHALHVTDMSGCPRYVCLRMLGADMRPSTDQEESMFDLANYDHWRVCRALEYAGLLREEEYPLEMPGEWGGRLDYVRADSSGLLVGDVKTVHPKGIRVINFETDQRVYDYPKPEHILQVSTYNYFYGLTHKGISPFGEILYRDRGGQNPSKATLSPVYKPAGVLAQMARFEFALEDCRKDGTLPPVLTPTLTWGKPNYDKAKNMTGGEIWRGEWRCNYCKIKQPGERGAKVTCPASREKFLVCNVTKTQTKGSEKSRYNSQFLRFSEAGHKYADEVEGFLESFNQKTFLEEE